MTQHQKGCSIDEDRFEKTDASVGTWFYKLEVTEEEKKAILHNQEIAKELRCLVNSIDATGLMERYWVKKTLERILDYGIRAK